MFEISFANIKRKSLFRACYTKESERLADNERCNRRDALREGNSLPK